MQFDARVPFFVREKLVSLIEKRIEALEKGYRQNIGLVGLPGYGKTYCLEVVFDALAAQHRFIPVYINAEIDGFELLVDRWAGSLLSGFFISQNLNVPQTFHSLLLAADPLIPKTTERIRHLKKLARREKPGHLMKELFSLSGILAEETGKKMVLILDEFDKLERTFLCDPFSTLGKEIMVQKDTLFLVSSSSPSKAREIFRDKLTMLFGNFEVVDFRTFTFKETRLFMESRLPEIRLTNAQLQFLIRLTDGIPAYVELLADQLRIVLAIIASSENALMKDFGPQMPDSFFLQAFHAELMTKGRLAQILDRKLDFCRMLSKDSASYIKALVAISHGRHKVNAIAAATERKLADTKKILQKLAEEDLVSRSGNFYLIQDPLFKFWIREVYERLRQSYALARTQVSEELFGILVKEFEKVKKEESESLGIRMERLFKDFSNDVFEIQGKKISCLQFSDVILRETGPAAHSLVVKNSRSRWHCQIASEAVKEEEVAALIEEIKKYRKKPQQKILIALQGIEQNAKLMAQQAGIQIWDLRLVNRLLDLYDLPKVVLLAQKEKYEPDMGALAQSVHSA